MYTLNNIKHINVHTTYFKPMCKVLGGDIFYLKEKLTDAKHAQNSLVWYLK